MARTELLKNISIPTNTTLDDWRWMIMAEVKVIKLACSVDLWASVGPLLEGKILLDVRDENLGVSKRVRLVERITCEVENEISIGGASRMLPGMPMACGKLIQLWARPGQLLIRTTEMDTSLFWRPLTGRWASVAKAGARLSIVEPVRKSLEIRPWAS